jgi:hypothetical protein
MGVFRTLVVGSVSIAFAGLCEAQQRTPTTTAAATVQGVLQRGEFLGPPNYEHPRTDRRERWFYLQLPATFQTQNPSFRLGPEFEKSDEYFIQLQFDSESAKMASRLIGRKVRVIGIPEAAVTAHDRTSITLNVQTMVQVQDWNW